jgi:hypothetical protein
MSWEHSPLNDGELESAGEELSKHIPGCQFRLAPYSNNTKPIFECYHSLTFPLFAVKGAIATGDWEMIIQRHKEVEVKDG